MVSQKNSADFNDDMIEGEKRDPDIDKENRKDQCGENGKGGWSLTSIKLN